MSGNTDKHATKKWAIGIIIPAIISIVGILVVLQDADPVIPTEIKTPADITTEEKFTKPNIETPFKEDDSTNSSNNSVIELLLNEAKANFYAKKYEDAIKNYDDILEIDSTFTSALYGRGKSLVALAIDQRYVEHGEDEITTYEDAQKSFSEAMNSFDKALELDPDYLDSLNGRGYTFLQQGYHGDQEKRQQNFEESLSIFVGIVKKDPNYHYAWYNAGMVLYEMERWDESYAYFDRAFEIAPEYYEDYWRP